jgi:hypothetical protein
MVYLHLGVQWSNLNRTEGNRNLHVVSKLPFVIGSQIIEPGIQAYTGKWAFGAKSLLV